MKLNFMYLMQAEAHAGGGAGVGSSARAVDALDVRAATTQVNHAQAVSIYNEFVDHANKQAVEKGLPEVYKKFHELTVEDVIGDELQPGVPADPNSPAIMGVSAEVAHFILEKKTSSGNAYSPLTAAQYFSSWKTALFKKFPGLAYRSSCPEWYEQLYRGLRMKATVECIKRGGRVSKKAVGMSAETLKSTALFLLKQEDANLGYEERAILVTLYHAVGRGGEVDSSVWNFASYDEDRAMIVFDWGESKNGVQYAMSMHPQNPGENNDGWLLDWPHSIACQLIGGPRKLAPESDMSFLFPAYVGMASGGAATKVSRIIKKARDGGVEGIPDEMASHGLRVTAADVMFFSYKLPLMSAVTRGGWDCKGDTLAFYYISNKKHIAEAGKVLAGWSDPFMKVSPPSLDAIVNSNNASTIESFCYNLFHETAIHNMLSNHLKPFRDTMAASLLMYYRETKAALGRESPIIRAIHRAALESHINLGDLPQFSKSIMERFKIQNAKNMAEDKDEAIENLTLMCVKLLDEQKEMKASLKRVEDGNNEMQGKLDQVIGAVEALTLTTPGSGSKRPRRESGIEPNDLSDRFARGAAQPAAAAPSAGQASRPGTAPSAPPQRSINAALTQGRDLSATIDWSKLGDWSGHQLLMTCLKTGQDWTKPNFLPPTLFPATMDKSTLRTKRSRAKSVLVALNGVAVASDQSLDKWFDVSGVPTDEAEKRSFLDDLTHQLVDGWMTQVVSVLYDARRSELNQERLMLEAQARGNQRDAKLATNKKQRDKLDQNKAKQSRNVTAIGNKIEAWGQNLFIEL